MNRVCGIYKITSPSGKIYIGQSVNINGRLCKYKSGKCKDQPKLYRSILKYGWNAHTFEVIRRCSQSELNDLEIYYINIFGCFNTKIGLNLHSGGNNHAISDETRAKLSASLKGRKLPKRSIEHSNKISVKAKERCNTPEYKNKISRLLKGTKPWNTGKNHPNSVKEKISESRRRNVKIIGDSTLYQCTGCLNFYPFEKFYQAKRSPTLLTAKCKLCESAASSRRKKNKKIISELNKPQP